ncbi:MAG TPA: peptidylprolyl isomerase [Balneolaceae bacterium]|nr:peptidylprolyl isomerase [Balneolaceae bacterium]
MKLTQQKNKAYISIFFILSIFLLPLASHAQEKSEDKPLDQIVAVVNDHIILKSDVDQQVQQYMMQMQQQQKRQIRFGKDIWYTVLENIIDRDVMLDKAKLDSVTVSDDMVDQQIDQRINSYVQQVGSEKALEDRMGKSIVQIKADLRDDYRQEMIVQRFQQQKRQDITITRPEVEDYFNSIPKDSLPTIHEQVALSQIVAVPPATKDAKAKARHLAEQLRDSVVNHGKTIEEMARKYSDGPSASNGGHIPLISIDDLVPAYSAAATSLQPGEISHVVETSFGFHVIRLNKRVGDKIDTNHILIKIDQNSYDDSSAVKKLEAIKDSVQNNKDITFSEMARKYSEDPNTAPEGGRILDPQSGQRLIALDQLDPALYRIVLLLDKAGDISSPKKFNLGNKDNSKKAYRIVRLDQHIPEHVANLKQDYQRIKQAARQSKIQRVMQKYIANLRKNMYVEYKIPVPDKYKNT